MGVFEIAQNTLYSCLVVSIVVLVVLTCPLFEDRRGWWFRALFYLVALVVMIGVISIVVMIWTR